MTTKKTRPVKAKKMPRALLRWLEAVVDDRAAPQDFSTADASAIIAALKHAAESRKRLWDAAAPVAVDVKGALQDLGTAEHVKIVSTVEDAQRFLDAMESEP